MIWDRGRSPLMLSVVLAASCRSPAPAPATPPSRPPLEAPDPVPPWPQVRTFEATKAATAELFSLAKPYRSKDGVTIALETGRIVCSRGEDQVALELGPFKTSTPVYAGYAEVVAFGALVQMRGSTDQLVLYPAGSKLFRANAACGDIDPAKLRAVLPKGTSLDGGRSLIEANGLCAVSPVDGSSTVVFGRHSGDIMLVYRAPSAR